MMSAGVSIHSKMGRHRATVSRVTSRVKPTASHRMFPTKRRRSL